jgi:adenine deaminase
VAHDSHNIVVVGTSEPDMLQAVRHLVELGGGMAVVADGQVLANLALPIAGLISPEPLGRVASAYEALKEAYRALGGKLQDPFMVLSFLALPVIPALKLTDLGLVDVDRLQVVSLFGPG